MEQSLDTEYKLFLMGDFNVNMLVAGNNTFKGLLQRLNQRNVVKKPTNFIANSGSCTCIDLALTNDVYCVEDDSVVDPICSSHCPVTVHLSFKTHKQLAYKRTIRNYNLSNFKDLNIDLALVDWGEEVFNSENINDIYNNFIKIYSTLIEQHVPTKTVTVRPSDKPYITTAIHRRMRQRKRIHRRAVRTYNPQHWQQLRNIPNEIIPLVRNPKREE